MSRTPGEMNGTTHLTRGVLDYGVVLELGCWIQQGHRMDHWGQRDTASSCVLVVIRSVRSFMQRKSMMMMNDDTDDEIKK